MLADSLRVARSTPAAGNVEKLINPHPAAGTEGSMDMQLADEQSIRAVLADSVPRRRRTAIPEFDRSHQAPRCRCGKCRQCLDDARWERIFNEKFADPNYYGYF